MAAQPQWIVDGSIHAQADLALKAGQESAQRLLLVDGVLEQADVEVIQRVIAGGGSAFDVEIRALAEVCVREDSIEIECLDPEAVDMLAANLLRAHVARCLQCAPGSITEPPLDIVARARSGSDLMLRPIETDVMRSTVDVGLGRRTNSPARDSIIYDRLTGTWHMD
ncbi:MAG: hypothetical protein MK101_01050 [Phycisphaerales bacterium]|nr:hypothetical protein [Phycisphaerales bacterium]